MGAWCPLGTSIGGHREGPGLSIFTAVLAVTATTATGKLACGGGGSLGPAVTAVSAADTRHLAVTRHHHPATLSLPLLGTASLPHIEM